MIRYAKYEDLPEILRMGKAFVESCGLDVEYDEASCESTAISLIDGERNGVLLIGEGGMIGGLVYPHFFNVGIDIAQELFFWVDPDRRGSGIGTVLLDGFESWAKEMGATRVSMIALAALKPVGRLYERRGYRPLEASWVKELTWQ